MNTPLQYYVLNGDQQLGPYTETELRNRAVSGAMPYDALVWREGLPEWTSFSDCFPLPPYDTIPQIPRHHAMQHPSISQNAKPIPRYPKWPWIFFAIFAFSFFSFAGWMSEIETEARFYIAEYDRMHSTEYAVSTGLEAFVRGVLGDHFGKANEEYGKAAKIEFRLYQLYNDHRSAAKGFQGSFWLTATFAILWIWKHRSYRKMLRS